MLFSKNFLFVDNSLIILLASKQLEIVVAREGSAALFLGFYFKSCMMICL